MTLQCTLTLLLLLRHRFVVVSIALDRLLISASIDFVALLNRVANARSLASPTRQSRSRKRGNDNNAPLNIFLSRTERSLVVVELADDVNLCSPLNQYK